MKPAFNAKSGYRFATDAEARNSRCKGALRGAVPKASRTSNRADIVAGLKRFD